jgi:hypothetical protein
LGCLGGTRDGDGFVAAAAKSTYRFWILAIRRAPAPANGKSRTFGSGQAGQTDRTENRTHLTEIRTGLGLVLLSLSLHSVQLLIKIIIDTTKDQDLLQVDN